ncbi:BrnA antitoxin family protein [Diaphorobacter sp.]|uniref:BrnA antitoxin family protein n=1 Tax=Diaphorobacter sp. TaxID=1934310 RepID=UPI003D10D77C
MTKRTKNLGLILPTAAEDAAINAGIAADPDNPELTEEFFKNARPASEVLPTEVYNQLMTLRGRGRPRGSVAAQTKDQVTLRLDHDVLEALKATGRGWQTRVNDLLRADIVSGRLQRAAR